MGEMADEVRLTFRNALTFNEDGSNLSKWATEAALVRARDRNLKPETRNPKSETRNPTPDTRNLTPETRNHTP